MGFGLIFIVLIVVVLVVLASNNGAGRGLFDSAPQRADTPLEILKKRYARGEIGKEEYEALRRELV